MIKMDDCLVTIHSLLNPLQTNLCLTTAPRKGKQGILSTWLPRKNRKHSASFLSVLAGKLWRSEGNKGPREQRGCSLYVGWGWISGGENIDAFLSFNAFLIEHNFIIWKKCFEKFYSQPSMVVHVFNSSLRHTGKWLASCSLRNWQ